MLINGIGMLRSPASSHVRRSPGRPRAFDMGTALDQAILVFREQGYHAASMAVLGEAMKLTPGSIYKAFSDKRALFLAALDRYTAYRGRELRAAMDAEPTGFDKLHATLRFYADASQGKEGRRGCLVVAAATELATFDADMAAAVTAALDRLELGLRKVIRLGQSDGSIPQKVDPDAVAFTLCCLLQGFRVMGKAGRSRPALMRAVEQALRIIR